MPDKYAELKKKYYRDYPDDGFWEYVRRNVKNLENIISDKSAIANLDYAYSVYSNLTPGQQASFTGHQVDYSGALGGRGPMSQFEQMYLAYMQDLYASDVAGGLSTSDEADAAYQTIVAQVQSEGLHSGIPKIGESGFLSQWTNYLSLWGTKVQIPGGGTAYSIGNVYFNTDGTRIPAQQQIQIQKLLGAQQEQEEQWRQTMWAAQEESAKRGVSYSSAGGQVYDPSAQLKDYFELNKRYASPEFEAHRSVLLPGESGRAEYDIVIAQDPAEAIRMGYGSYFPSDKWNSPYLQNAYQSAYVKNLQTMLTRLEFDRRTKTGTQDVTGRGVIRSPSGVFKEGMVTQENFPVWETIPWDEWKNASFAEKIGWLTEAERNQAEQMARKDTIEGAGGSLSAPSHLIYNERSPSWHTDPVTGERVQGAWRVSTEEWLAMRAKKNAIEAGTARGALNRKREISNAMARAGVPGGAQGLYESAFASYMAPKGGRGLEKSETPTPGSATPSWLPQFVPGLKPGAPLVLGQKMTTPSPQQWLQTPPWQQNYLQQYIGYGQQLQEARMGKTKSPTYEDLLWGMGVGRSGSARTGTTLFKQRA